MQDITSWGQLILAVAIAVLTIVVIPILPQLKALVVALITAKVNEVQSKYGNDTSAHYVKILNDTIYDVVNGLSQSTVDGLKSLTENGGKLPPGKADELKNQALGEVLSAISDERFECHYFIQD